MLVTGPCHAKHFVCLFSFTHYSIPLREPVLSAPFSSWGNWSSGRSHNLFRVKELIRERAGFQWWIDNNISLVILYQELSISLQSGHLHFWKKRQKVFKCLRKLLSSELRIPTFKLNQRSNSQENICRAEIKRRTWSPVKYWCFS